MKNEQHQTGCATIAPPPELKAIEDAVTAFVQKYGDDALIISSVGLKSKGVRWSLYWPINGQKLSNHLGNIFDDVASRNRAASS